MRRLLAMLLPLLLLAGCAASHEVEENETDWSLYQQEQLSAPENTEPEPPAYPDAFSMPYHKDYTLDPVTCGEGIQQDVASLIYEPLFRLNASFEPEPVLCESWEWDESGMICTLTLREEARFQDGTALRAADAAATLQRAVQSERYAYRLRNVAGIAANRSGQLVITLRAPDRGLLSLLDIPVVKSGTENRIAPTGTGPYCFVSGEGADFLSADPEWWQGRSLPVETIPLVNAKDRTTAMYLFSSRKAELMTVDPTDDLTAVGGQYETAYQPTTILQFIGFNSSGGIFSEAEVRRAFSEGIPRETMADAQMAHLAVAAQFPISPLSPLYPADLERSYDRDKAHAALLALIPEDSGEGEGDTEEAAEAAALALLVNEEDPFRLTSARFIAESLSVPGGWQVEVRALPWEEYLAALEGGNFDLYYGEVRLTADWDLADLVGSGGALNYGGYASEFTDSLLLDFAAGLDRSGNARRLASQLLEEAPIAPVCFKNYTVLTHPGVAEGISPLPSGGICNLDEWTIHLSQSAVY